MKLHAIAFVLLFLSMLCAKESSAQNTQYDTAKLDIITGPQLKNNAGNPADGNVAAGPNDGFAIVVSSGVLYSFNQAVKDTFSQGALFMPSLGFYFNKNFSFYAEFARASIAKRRNDKNISIALNYVSAGFCNQARLTDRISLRQKLGLNILNVQTVNMEIPGSLTVGFIAGAGLQTQADNRLLLYMDADYIYQKNNFGGFRFEPGIIFQF